MSTEKNSIGKIVEDSVANAVIYIQQCISEIVNLQRPVSKKAEEKNY